MKKTRRSAGASDPPDKAERLVFSVNTYVPEGALVHTPENKAALQNAESLLEAARRGKVLEAVAVKCDAAHDLHVDLGCMRGVIPRAEGADGIREGSVRDIALISRVGKPVCFVVTALTHDAAGAPVALLSRAAAQKKCREEYLSALCPGDVIDAVVTHLESFAAFCDVGAGVSAMLPIDAISVSRIPHPNARLRVRQQIRAAVRARDEFGRLLLTHRELLGTWEENAALFAAGETVPGIVRSVESYGVFVELTPNLAGLAEYNDAAAAGQSCAVYIKSILPQSMKIKLIIVDTAGSAGAPALRYFFTGRHMDRFVYSPPQCPRVIETVF